MTMTPTQSPLRLSPVLARKLGVIKRRSANKGPNFRTFLINYINSKIQAYSAPPPTRNTYHASMLATWSEVGAELVDEANSLIFNGWNAGSRRMLEGG